MASMTVSSERRNRLTKLASLGAEDWRVLLTAWCLLPLIAISLRVFDYPRTRNVMERFVQGIDSATAPEIHVGRVTRLVPVAARHGAYRASCLCLALAVWWLLARRGVETTLRIGVRKDQTGFSAHAWVERDGVVLTGGADAHERYQPVT
jgi:hypothetical protein